VNATGTLTQAWGTLLAHTVSEFARLVFVAECLDSNTGKYRTAILHDMVLEPEIVQVLHELIWETWIHASLPQQEAALRTYLNSLPGSFAEVVALWRYTAPYRAFPPISVSPEARILFNSNIELLLQLFAQQAHQDSNNECGSFAPIVAFLSVHYADPTLSIRFSPHT
jgi:hypothetical protein